MHEYGIAVATVVGLFLLGVASPGPNFLIVVERSMSSGFRAGAVTGAGVATGDALYAGAGLLGMAALVSQAGWIFGLVKLLGGAYLVWLGARMIARRGREVALHPTAAQQDSLARSFRIGLLTDLANPKTVVFFASIFATVYDPRTPNFVAVAMWAGIVLSSLIWRMGLSLAFSRNSMRSVYRRFRSTIEAVFGSLLIGFGVRLAVSGRAQYT